MNKTKRTSINDLNQHLTCKLCKGYYVDATTIIECLHSFCRSCIVKYLETNKYCPVCDVQVHKTKPLTNIRSDKILQDIVYKIVPKLFQNEYQRRKDHLQSHPIEYRSQFDKFIDLHQHLAPSDETISLSLSYHDNKESTRYLRCPSAVSIAHIQKLIRNKYGLSDSYHIEVLFVNEVLDSTLTLTDVAYIYKKKLPIELTYRIYDKSSTNATKKQTKLSGPGAHCNHNNNNWKEVQLRISENGEMSITGIQEVANNNNNNNNNNKASTKTVYSTIDKCNVTSQAQNDVSSVVTTGTTTAIATVTSAVAMATTTVATVATALRKDEKNLKRKLSVAVDDSGGGGPVEKKQAKQTILNFVNSRPQQPQQQQLKKDKCQPCYMPKAAVINIPKPSPGLVAVTSPSTPPVHLPLPPPLPPTPPATTKPLPNLNAITSSSPTMGGKIRTKPSTPIGYKTLRDPPKSWNSQIANINKAAMTVGESSDAKDASRSIRPANKFFKMRNNVPRYLGNPASGVKPMYGGSAGDKQTPIAAKNEIKKHSIVKVDPKTLKPISEKAPDVTSLSGGNDLKINTSSVSIFNPLKLQQSSPKGGGGGGGGCERKSPKSPHSPNKVKGAAMVTAATTSKREASKLNLNFTPSNPFIPNLTSPTMNPNQFLFPTGPFPPYDPRMMAAYHNFLYGQRMAFPPLTLDPVAVTTTTGTNSNHRSIKAALSPLPLQQLSPQANVKFLANLTPEQSSTSRGGGGPAFNTSITTTTTTTTTNTTSKSQTKKNCRDPVKMEKSLQNAVDKLTQQQNKAKIKEDVKKAEENDSCEKVALVAVKECGDDVIAKGGDDGKCPKEDDDSKKKIVADGDDVAVTVARSIDVAPSSDVIVTDTAEPTASAASLEEPKLEAPPISLPPPLPSPSPPPPPPPSSPPPPSPPPARGHDDGDAAIPDVLPSPLPLAPAEGGDVTNVEEMKSQNGDDGRGADDSEGGDCDRERK